MDTALRLDYESNRPLKNRKHMDRNKLNVAHVCTGLAFELAYKSLLVAEFQPIKQTHSIEKLHEILREETQEVVLTGCTCGEFRKECLIKDAT